MIPASDELRAAVNSEEIDLIETAEFFFYEPWQEPSLRLVNTDSEWLLNGVVYRPSLWSRGDIEDGTRDQAVLELNFDDVSKEFAELTDTLHVEGIVIRLTKIIRRYLDVNGQYIDLVDANGTVDPSNIKTRWYGRVVSADFPETVMSVRVAPFGYLSVGERPRRTYRRPCSHRLGDEWCAVDLTLPKYNYTGIVSNVSTRRLIYDLGLKQVDGFWNAGYVKMVTGKNAGLVRRIRKFVPATAGVPGELHLMSSFPYPITNEAYAVRPDCFFTKGDCRDRYNNLTRFGGFAEIPLPIAITGVGIASVTR